MLYCFCRVGYDMCLCVFCSVFLFKIYCRYKSSFLKDFDMFFGFYMDDICICLCFGYSRFLFNIDCIDRGSF